MMYGLSNHTCPRCREPLYIGLASSVTLHGCGRCGGVWLGSACARRIAEALPGDAIELAGRVSKNAKGEIQTHAPVACPICASPMTRTRAAAAGVELDVCGQHGTWYDRNELEQIAAALARSDWRSGTTKRDKTAVAAGVAGAAIAAGAVAHAAESPQGARVQEAVAETIVEVGAEVVLEGAFEIIGGILGAIFD
ncbi:MAG: zf-TFIIB domain-containing protein [Polyangiaceae bacterium]|nr:zf-TFIIB domain-containing protein [Polyangiaceae bacterium]